MVNSMNKNGIKEIIKLTSKLSPSEKIFLAEKIWESINENSKSSGEEHRRIICKRIEAENKSSDEVYTWEEVKEYARQSKSNAKPPKYKSRYKGNRRKQE